jgi:hypothetical protein
MAEFVRRYLDGLPPEIWKTTMHRVQGRVRNRSAFLRIRSRRPGCPACTPDTEDADVGDPNRHTGSKRPRTALGVTTGRHVGAPARSGSMSPRGKGNAWWCSPWEELGLYGSKYVDLTHT